MIKCTVGKIPKTHWIYTSVFFCFVFFARLKLPTCISSSFHTIWGGIRLWGCVFFEFFTLGQKTRLPHAEGNSIIKLWNTTTGKQRLHRATAWIVNSYRAKYFLPPESKTKLENENISCGFIWFWQKECHVNMHKNNCLPAVQSVFYCNNVSIVFVACFHDPHATQKYYSFSRLHYPFYYQFWFLFLDLSSGISRRHLRGLSSLFRMDDSDSLKLIRQHFQLRSLVWIPIT